MKALRALAYTIWIAAGIAFGVYWVMNTIWLYQELPAIRKALK